MARQPKTANRNPQKHQQAPSLKMLFQQGVALHQQGQLTQAQSIYEHILAMQPQHVDTLHLLGMVVFQSGNPARAVDLIGRAIQINPKAAALRSNLGIALHELGRLEDALASYDRAIALKPDYAEAYYNRGSVLHDLSRLEEEVASYDRAIALRPDYVEAYYNRGNVLLELKHLEAAVASYDAVIAMAPDFADGYYNRGNALRELKRQEEAVASYDQAIAIKPNYAEAYSNRGVALEELNRQEEAVACYDHAIAVRPDYAEAYSNRGNALQGLKRLDEALASHDRAIDIKPGYAEAYYNRGKVLKELKRLEDAVASYDQAIATKPDYAEAYYNRGIALQDLKRLEDAVTSYDRVIAIKPDFADGSWNKSLALLIQGDFKKGWALYEWRWRREESTPYQRNFPQPLWLGDEDLAGKTILLHAEQGLGDSIQFCRYVKHASELGARVVLEVQKPLVGLFEKLVGVSEIVEQGLPLPAFDYHCPLLSLPLAFKTELATVPSLGPYLSSTAEKRSVWSARLGAKTKPRVGIVWSGSTANKNDHNRSLLLAEIVPHLPANCEYVSLQKEIRAVDQDAMRNSSIKHYGEELTDYTDTAALCDLMDVVVSVDTSVAHLAGALGRKTWVLLPYVPEWRWLLDREDSPWYETVKLYRQDEKRCWDSVLARVARGLQGLTKTQ